MLVLNPAELAFNQEMGFHNKTLEFIDQGLQRIYDTQMSKFNLFSMRFNILVSSMPSLVICIVSYSLDKPLRGEEDYSSTTSSFRIICLVFCILYLMLGFVFFREKFLPIMKYIFSIVSNIRDFEWNYSVQCDGYFILLFGLVHCCCIGFRDNLRMVLT